MSDLTATLAPMPVKLIETKLIRKGALIASAKITIGKLVLHDVSILCSNGKSWASAPSKPQIGRDGAVVKGDNGKTRYVPVVEWVDKDARERFSQGVIAAFEDQHGPVLALVGRAA